MAKAHPMAKFVSLIRKAIRNRAMGYFFFELMKNPGNISIDDKRLKSGTTQVKLRFPAPSAGIAEIAKR